MRGELSAVEGLCRTFWEVRGAGGGRIDKARVPSYGRMLAEACHADMQSDPGYDPEEDERVLWAREVLAAARRLEPRSLAGAEKEATAAFMLGTQECVVLCGKDRAAGMTDD